MKLKTKVLLIDDDILLGQLLTTALKEEGYEVFYQTSLAGSRGSVAEARPHIIILNTEVGDKSSIEIAPELKAIVPETPLLFISSHAETSILTKALEVGGVALITKPFATQKLIAYINRHAVGSHSFHLSLGSLSLNTKTRALMLGTEMIRQLSQLEYKLLKLLATYPNQTINRELIGKELWGNEGENQQSLNNFITKLRKYLSVDNILELKTIHNYGYKLLIHAEVI